MEYNKNNTPNQNNILSVNNFDNINQYCPKVSLEQKIKNLEYQNIKLKSEIELLKNIISNLNEKILTYENMMRINKIPIPQQIINHDIQFIKTNDNKILNSKLPKRLNKKEKKNQFNIITNINKHHILKNQKIQNLESDDLINLKEENDFRIGNLYIDSLNDNFIDEPNDVIEVDLSNNLFNEFIFDVNNIDNLTYEQLLDLENKIGYVKRGISPNLNYLRNKLINTGKINEKDTFNIEVLKEMLIKRFEQVDFEQVKNDTERFIINNEDLSTYSKDLFVQMAKKIK